MTSERDHTRCTKLRAAILIAAVGTLTACGELIPGTDPGRAIEVDEPTYATTVGTPAERARQATSTQAPRSSQFQVGDCAMIVERSVDYDLVPERCEGAVGSFDIAERVYRVDSIIGHTRGGCPQLRGFFPVEFVHQPDGVTYCLVQQS